MQSNDTETRLLVLTVRRAGLAHVVGRGNALHRPQVRAAACVVVRPLFQVHVAATATAAAATMVLGVTPDHMDGRR